MIPIGVFLIVLGTGWLLDFNAWPAIAIGAGVAYILSAVFGRSRSSVWALPACCYPLFWVGKEPESRGEPHDKRAGIQR